MSKDGSCAVVLWIQLFKRVAERANDTHVAVEELGRAARLFVPDDVADVDALCRYITKHEDFRDDLSGIGPHKLYVYSDIECRDMVPADSPVPSSTSCSTPLRVVRPSSRPTERVPSSIESAGLWLMSGSVSNALTTKGIRSLLYRLADGQLGYYDPCQKNALFYQGQTLMIHIVFERKEQALQFDSRLQNEAYTMGSALKGVQISVKIESHIHHHPTQLIRIYSHHYSPTESESPQDSMITIAETTICSINTPEFRYQRIEADRVFGPFGKAESCHVMSREHCLSMMHATQKFQL
ncbi:hypothetical protein SeLEV6574_g03227 [Synchytrium endobioticum]|uniref:Uncharacterized protein n=1 Tax=Synchytrium endobioticum TaxID=286115 RepID=A0A507D4U0_9FUNG|nr:hypothetical protein SeLEV6574_g03227 [Synchytrium endobioticum]